MRCKPGDLAFIVGECLLFPENLGALVRVVSPAAPYACDPGVHYWVCEAVGRPLKYEEAVAGIPTGWTGYSHSVDIADAHLRPIRGDQGEDEILRIAGYPACNNQPEHA